MWHSFCMMLFEMRKSSFCLLLIIVQFWSLAVSAGDQRCSNSDIRLTGGNTANEGRVEICRNGVWERVCTDHWNDNNTRVVCNQLRFNTSIVHKWSYTMDEEYDSGMNYSILDTHCRGNESRLSDCIHDNDTATLASCPQDISVFCRLTKVCENGDVRLTSTVVQYEGRVEICFEETWGAVCDSDWTASDAQVTCKQLQYQGGAFPVNSTATLRLFGSGNSSNQSIVNNVACSGIQEKLQDCSITRASGGTAECGVAVHCSNLVPDAPDSVAATPTGPHSLHVTWLAPNEVEIHGVILHYKITCNDLSSHTVDNVTQVLSVHGLQPYTFYECCVLAVNLAGEGMTKCDSTVTHEMVPLAPQIVAVKRSSATSIQVIISELTTLEERRGIITFYYVYYEKTTGSCSTTRCPYSSESNSSHTVSVTRLDPGFQYCIAAAARNSAGIGECSKVHTVELYDNSNFTLELGGTIHCMEWTSNRRPEKIAIIVRDVVKALIQQCNCSLSSPYIAEEDLICRYNDSDHVLFQARIISTRDVSSVNFLHHLQEWVDTAPVLSIQGTLLTVSANCDVHLEVLGDANITCSQPQNSGAIAAGVVVSLTLLIALVAIGTATAFIYLWYRRRTSNKNNEKNDIEVTENTLPKPEHSKKRNHAQTSQSSTTGMKPVLYRKNCNSYVAAPQMGATAVDTHIQDDQGGTTKKVHSSSSLNPPSDSTSSILHHSSSTKSKAKQTSQTTTDNSLSSTKHTSKQISLTSVDVPHSSTEPTASLTRVAKSSGNLPHSPGITGQQKTLSEPHPQVLPPVPPAKPKLDSSKKPPQMKLKGKKNPIKSTKTTQEQHKVCILPPAAAKTTKPLVAVKPQADKHKIKPESKEERVYADVGYIHPVQRAQSEEGHYEPVGAQNLSEPSTKPHIYQPIDQAAAAIQPGSGPYQDLKFD